MRYCYPEERPHVYTYILYEYTCGLAYAIDLRCCNVVLRMIYTCIWVINVNSMSSMIIIRLNYAVSL